MLFEDKEKSFRVCFLSLRFGVEEAYIRFETVNLSLS
jgi:hypothetical protein